MVAIAPGLLRVEQIMGLPIVVDARDEVDGEAIDAVFDWLRFVDATFSTYQDDSEISRLNRGELALDQAHPHVREVLDRCDEIRLATDGYFDVRFDGNSVDPSGFVKGWSIDRAATILDQAGLRNYAINAGGDLLVRGGELPHPAWRIGIQHPLVSHGVAAVIEGTDLAVATSAQYARGTHIRDPRTGLPPLDVLSVTVTGPDLATTDAYATAAFAMGARGPHWTARLRGYDAMTILSDASVLSTPGFPEH